MSDSIMSFPIRLLPACIINDVDHIVMIDNDGNIVFSALGNIGDIWAKKGQIQDNNDVTYPKIHDYIEKACNEIQFIDYLDGSLFQIDFDIMNSTFIRNALNRYKTENHEILSWELLNKAFPINTYFNNEFNYIGENIFKTWS